MHIARFVTIIRSVTRSIVYSGTSQPELSQPAFECRPAQLWSLSRALTRLTFDFITRRRGRA